MIRLTARTGIFAGIGLLAIAVSGAGHADTLREALIAAYQTNPTLQSARARQRANDENVPIEKAAGRPSVTSQTTYTEFLRKSPNNFTSPDRVLSANLELGVPIYSGGSVRNAVKAAKTRVEAGQAELRGAESAIFSQVVAAYMDVILQEAVVGLNTKQVEVLDVNFQATSDRYEIGDLTRTDVAQSQARLALARSDSRTAKANLAAAREIYIQLVGNPPETLAPPPPLPNIPASAQEAVAIALEHNPDIIAAQVNSKAAEYDIEVAGSGRLPSVDLFSGGAYQDYFGTLVGS